MNALQRQNMRRGPLAVQLSTLVALAAAATIVTMSAACATESTGAATTGEPWGTNTVRPADLVQELAGEGGVSKPVIVCTAPPFLYRTARIPGAVLHGPASSPEC